MIDYIKKLWVDALRSGEYIQTTGRLKKSDGYCCLGVLCDIYSKQHPDLEIEWEPEHNQFIYPFYRFLNESNGLPQEVVAWAGLPSSDPKIKMGEEEKEELSTINDNGISFNDIADLIETEL